jgi:hypothetical protein
VFVILIGEDWPGVFYNYANAFPDKASMIRIFFIIILIIGNFMLLSLFTTILLENFE